jgi:hypothetical protein
MKFRGDIDSKFLAVKGSVAAGRFRNMTKISPCLYK